MSNSTELETMAEQLWTSDVMRTKWVAAITYLRKHVKGGWVRDQVSSAVLREQTKAITEAQAAVHDEVPRFADRVVTPMRNKARR